MPKVLESLILGECGGGGEIKSFRLLPQKSNPFRRREVTARLPLPRIRGGALS
jgi:hypothetical protein